MNYYYYYYQELLVDQKLLHGRRLWVVAYFFSTGDCTKSSTLVVMSPPQARVDESFQDMGTCSFLPSSLQVDHTMAVFELAGCSI
jgi:hypothetical protein